MARGPRRAGAGFTPRDGSQGINPCATVTAMTQQRKTRWGRGRPARLSLPDYHVYGAWYFVTICCRDKEPLFRTERARDLLLRTLLETADDHNVELAAYSILPNHLHLVSSCGKDGLIHFVRIFKGRTTKAFRKYLGESSPWQSSFFDHKIRSEESLAEKCRYVWMNPVRLGLVTRSQDYRWNGHRRTD